MDVEEKTALKQLYHVLIQKDDPDILPYLHTLGEIVGHSSEFITLKSLLASDQWPEAIDQNLICAQDSETDKISRAEGILELLVEKDLRNKKFLDFGCGEGHVAYKALTQEPLISVGYDKIHMPSWSKFPTNDKLLFTTDFETAKQHSPYDIILVYDVIDHVSHKEALAILRQIHDLLDINGTIYLRTHPFCSRHATHLYQTINKAYIHLVFTNQELKDLGYEAPDNTHVVYPINQYETMFKEADLAISHNNILREKVDAFFKKTPLIKERIRMHYKDSSDKHIRNGGFPEYQCEQQFLDYVLKRKNEG